MQEFIDALSLLQAMFPMEGEFLLLSAPETVIEGLQEVNFPDATSVTVSICVDFKICISLQDEVKWPLVLRFKVDITAEDSPGQRGSLQVNIERADYITRAVYDDLQTVASIARTQSDLAESVLGIIDTVKEKASTITLTRAVVPVEASETLEPVEEARVWFWLPSLSTREKRRDLVNYATDRGLTGFVLAGKPGLLCVEGHGKVVEEYMSSIKSDSWSDIPSYQKKVTERYRQPITTRAFQNMREITSQITQGGQHGNRGNMGEVKQFMTENGVGDAFGIVVGSGGFE